MCNISGAPSLEKAHQLYIDGLERGSFASGVLVFTQNHFYLSKQESPFTLENLKKELKSLEEFPIYYLFHSRAPTNSKNLSFDYCTTHPFNFGFNFVAHNGIIQNFTDFSNHKEFEVDSSIIPYHLSMNKGDIIKTYSNYKGLLTSWIYDTEKLYLVKAGSSLHMDQDSFSSIAFKGSQQIEEDGIIYEFTGLNFKQIGIFPYNNPYFLL
jgi:hypothetical protein